jgi:long-chain fatty acid transport protein
MVKSLYAVPFLFCLGCVAQASANPAQDTFGLGAKAKALGGAGTVLSDDYSAVYYNPARMTRCQGQSLSIAYALSAHALDTVSAAGEAIDTTPIPMRQRLNLGSCLRLPFDFAFGFFVGAGLHEPMHLAQTTATSTPNFLMHNSRLDTLSLMFGGAYALTDRLSFGLSLSVLAGSDLRLALRLPVLSEEEVAIDLNWNLKPKVAVYAGLFFEAWAGFEFALVYRSALYHRLYAVTDNSLSLSSVDVELDLLIEGVMWYSPQQVSVGIAYTHQSPNITMSADIIWMNWSAYPGPFIQSAGLSDSTLATSLNFPADEDLHIQDVIVLRTGAQYTHANFISYRIGYTYRPSPLPLPQGRANLLDTDTHSFSTGLGFDWRWGQGDSSKHLTLDLFGCLGWLPTQSVTKSSTQPEPIDFSFGGYFFDAGLNLKLGY